MSTEGIGVVLCDDLAEMRELFRDVLEMDGLRVMGEAEDGETAVRLAAELQPDVIVLDLTMPVLDGLDAIPLIRERAPGTAIVVLSGHGEHDMAAPALAAGADRYLSKGAELAEISAVVRGAAESRGTG